MQINDERSRSCLRDSDAKNVIIPYGPTPTENKYMFMMGPDDKFRRENISLRAYLMIPRDEGGWNVSKMCGQRKVQINCILRYLQIIYTW